MLVVHYICCVVGSAMIENGSYFHAYDYSSKLRDRPTGAVNAQSYWARTVRASVERRHRKPC